MNETPTVDAPAPQAGPTYPPPPPPPYTSGPRPPLRRSRSDRVIAGVCGGIGQRYGVDPVLLRILVVVLTIFSGGTFLLAYLLGWLFIADEPRWVVPMPGQPGPGGYAAYPPPTAAYAGPAYAAGGTGTYVDPGSGAIHAGTTPPVWTPPRRREPKSYLGLIAVSVAVVVGGGLALAAANGASISVAVVTAAMLAVLGAGLLVGAFRGRARWLIAPSLLLLLVTQAALVIPRGLNDTLHGGAGDVTWRPTVTAPPSYELGAGTARLDLTRIPAGAAATVKAHVGIGQLVVTLPSTTRLVLHAHVGAGDIRIPGDREDSGLGVVSDRTLDPTAGTQATTTVDLTVEIGLGELEVRRASS